ncbi:ectoine synthase [Hoyosella sp. G463]|uniref:L-ectoine synthase n=1 Tax=Lolliginicoccus lacisalsi TaxID=2742202 RepID=A0A927JAL7_9ACTN|nr:ectoine synthase [Lolliginicoccus lacisalsi]MBD8505664.1 ectoine synthase [Lolliginicoccus lacisalsi]
MIVRTTQDITNTERDVEAENGNWRSKRIVLADDRVGFSFHETVIKAGTVNDFWYANHVEAVWLVEGRGRLTDLETGTIYDIGPGSMYLLNGFEKHRLEVDEQMRMMCVFNPPVTGREVHDEHGVYPLITLDE